jgi:hypothetical protein
LPTSNPPLPFALLYSATGNQAYGLSQFSPAVGNITGNYLAGQTLTSTIVDLTGSASFSYQVASVTQSGLTTTLSYTYPPPANIAGILKTPIVYSSIENGASTVVVAYSVTDQFGNNFATFFFCFVLFGDSSSYCFLSRFVFNCIFVCFSVNL